MELVTWLRLHADRALALGLMIAGTVLIVVGWIGVSGEVYIAKQVPYVVSGGVGGLALLIVAATLWLSADMNDEWHLLDQVDEQHADLRRQQQEFGDRLDALEKDLPVVAAESNGRAPARSPRRSKPVEAS